VAERPGISLQEILQSIVELLPPAWQYSEIAFGRIILDGVSYTTPDFQKSRQKQSADIIVSGKRRGVIEVFYTEKKPELDEGPFLKEERNLIDAVARQVVLIIERRETKQEKSNLQDQLRHAERLATIGQLAAGVAHELNEPLGNILGFAQLAKKCPGLPHQAEKDIEQIVTASLHAREVIKKLLLSARQMPPEMTQVNLNQVVEDGLYLLEARCAKQGIELVRSLPPDLPEITADPAQLNQILVNLVVNSVQAMPEGGRLTVQTIARKGHILLIVEDTGIGMSEEVIKQIFIPFFTTKDIDQGTGLGLAVVHGIVTSHGGSIRVESKVGCGTRFEVQLPVTGSQGIKKSGQDGTFS
jgi:signal transduction histidine kinase